MYNYFTPASDDNLINILYQCTIITHASNDVLLCQLMNVTSHLFSYSLIDMATNHLMLV